jgi:hypothetical protein
MDLVNYSFGNGGMTCGLDQNVLPAFVQYLKRQYVGKLPTKVAIIRPGTKKKGLYFLNETITIDEFGTLVDSAQEDHIWLKKDLIYECDKMIVSDIMPTIQTPLTSSVLKTLLIKFKKCLKHNFIPGLLVVAGAAMSFHYQLIVSLYSGCSMIVASGPSATGKTTAMRVGLSLFGCCNNNVFVKGTNRGFLERSSLSTLPYGIDDPQSGRSRSKANKLDLCELAVDLYNGSPTTNYATGILTPLSIPIVATNFKSEAEER